MSHRGNPGPTPAAGDSTLIPPPASVPHPANPPTAFPLFRELCEERARKRRSNARHSTVRLEIRKREQEKERLEQLEREKKKNIEDRKRTVFRNL